LDIELGLIAGYYLTQHPATRSNPIAPGTPERPLSDLGLKGYTAYWISIILRFCRQVLADAPPHAPPTITPLTPSKRASRSIKIVRRNVPTTITINDVEVSKLNGTNGQYSISLSLADLAKACHLRSDDVASTLSQLGFLNHRRKLPKTEPKPNPTQEVEEEDQEEAEATPEEDGDEWVNTEIIITREGVAREWMKWKVRPTGVLDESCVLL
jgi:histone acetyltransferase MYST1